MDAEDLPDWIRKNPYILTSNRRNFKRTECDNLCMFGTLAEYFLRNKILDFGRTPGKVTKQLFLKYQCSKPGNQSLKPADFPGVTMDEIPSLEHQFELAINVYVMELLPERNPMHPKALKGSLIYYSKEKEPRRGVCHIMRHDNHLMLITDLERALGSYQCPFCGVKIDYDTHHYRRHVKVCAQRNKNNETKQNKIYHSAELYKPYPTIFQQIREEGIDVPVEIESTHHYLATFDIETYFEKFEEVKKRGKSTEGMAKLIPFVIGTASNVPGFENAEFFWSDTSTEGFCLDFVNYLIRVSERQNEILEELFEDVYEQLEMKKITAEENENDYGKKLYKRLINQLEELAGRLPVIGFK